MLQPAYAPHDVPGVIEPSGKIDGGLELPIETTNHEGVTVCIEGPRRGADRLINAALDAGNPHLLRIVSLKNAEGSASIHLCQKPDTPAPMCLQGYGYFDTARCTSVIILRTEAQGLQGFTSQRKATDRRQPAPPRVAVPGRQPAKKPPWPSRPRPASVPLGGLSTALRICACSRPTIASLAETEFPCVPVVAASPDP